jgi:hypothetical protein
MIRGSGSGIFSNCACANDPGGVHRLGTLLTRLKELSVSMDDEDWTALFQLDWSGQTLESLQAMAKTGRNYHFQHYYYAEPEWSVSFGFRERFRIWHTGMHHLDK